MSQVNGSTAPTAPETDKPARKPIDPTARIYAIANKCATKRTSFARNLADGQHKISLKTVVRSFAADVLKTAAREEGGNWTAPETTAPGLENARRRAGDPDGSAAFAELVGAVLEAPVVKPEE